MSINAKLLASGLVLALLGAGFALTIDRSGEALIDASDRVVNDGTFPLARIEAAAIRADELSERFEREHRGDINRIVTREEATQIAEGLSKVMSELRTVSVNSGPIAARLDELDYGINRLRMADGEITRRLVRRELTQIVASLNGVAQNLRKGVDELRQNTVDRSGDLKRLIIAGSIASLVAGLLILLYLSRSIAGSIRQATSNLLRVSGEEQLAPAGGDAIAELEAAIEFVEVALEGRMQEISAGGRETARRYEGELQRQQKRFEAALNNVPQAFCVLDDTGRLLSVNAAFSHLFPSMKVGMSTARADGDPLLARLLAPPHHEFETREAADGRSFELRRHASPQVGGTIVIFEDVTRIQAVSREMERLSGQDALTGLANRARFYASLETMLRDEAIEGEIAVLSIDVEDFNTVNATLGQAAGDDLLRQLGERFRSLVPDDALVARLDGDEFGILITLDGEPGSKQRLARAVMESVDGRPIRVAGRPLAVAVAVGMVVVGRDDRVAGLDAARAMQNCELALQQAKAQPGRKFKAYRPELREELQAKQLMIADLRAALERNEFELHFQPFVDLRRQAASGFEALVRWRHPTRGLVGPATFIPLMEEMGLIVPLGRFVLIEACRHAAGWPGNLTLSVNLSPVQVKSQDLVTVVQGALRSSGLAAERLQLEVTESLFLDDAEGVLGTLQRLRELGLVISMDDFGTGYSSLGYLSRFPFDKIKIDQSFVRDMNRDENIAIVRAVMGLGAAMRMSVIAEGVETVDQLMRLEQEGCSEVQGYLFSKPRPASDLPKMLMEIREGFRTGRFRRPAETEAARAS
ncbi:putative bifunctional diguanylate cyclase/phosphodiesterase [Aureimonas phyllosphaerae]|uniref:Diguanylate cyclase (GGDEF)-like protein n=1 Tax=Aureimonas phyllosphaerae TaxID=1166078 RepID=A0A7W6BRK2_9HYPH|nr:EAL domain-containing protein [Aureimonas phyllosphaerae]MBB3935587.1 diguanylate cyclase (GGDEF)-like protein [Aureimonas phyllosphaerae]MBB3959595.1 diguanylate cyclase (GGDEF)-like protein [Aureimonas phyllosphaerae]SFF12651.1 diguanylate cyclase (GGDEF) domain-containing protein [Aureimonas phyllosphaerae]